MTTMMTPENWAKTSRELVTQTRRWAETMRGMSISTWQGMLGAKELVETTKPFVEMVTTTHDQMLDLWETGAKAAIDHTVKLTDQIKPVL